MPASLGITEVQRRDEKLYVRFDDGTEVEATRRELRQFCRQILDDNNVRELLKAILISRGLRAVAEDADDLDALIGQTATFNHKAVANICRIA